MPKFKVKHNKHKNAFGHSIILCKETENNFVSKRRDCFKIRTLQ